MFSRKHPYLFFLLCIASLFTGAMIFISILFTLGMKGAGLVEWVDMGGQRIGIVEIYGVILEPDEILNHIKQFREDETIKAIVLRINSPGGGVAPSQEIYKEILKTVPIKTVVASMGSVAASGGYYVAAGANKIVANPGTITGSIGVILGYTNFQELLKKIGLTPVVIKSGKYKDIGSPTRKMSDEEKRILQQFTDEVHQQFVAAIAEGRKMEKAVVESIADGRIMTGETAKSMGLVDNLGNLEDALALAGELAGIEGKITKVYPKEKPPSFFRYLVGESLSEVMGRLTHSNISAQYLSRIQD
jgi:protease-4